MPSAAAIRAATAGALRAARVQAAKRRGRERISRAEFGQMIEVVLGLEGKKGGASRASVERWENVKDPHGPPAAHLFAALALAGVDITDVIVRELAEYLAPADVKLMRPRGNGR